MSHTKIVSIQRHASGKKIERNFSFLYIVFIKEEIFFVEGKGKENKIFLRSCENILDWDIFNYKLTLNKWCLLTEWYE
jgi:hypothetical protein